MAFVELVPVLVSDVPEEFKKDVQWVKHELTKKESKYFNMRSVNGKLAQEPEGRLAATLRGMRIVKAVEIAERICYLAARLGEIHETT